MVANQRPTRVAALAVVAAIIALAGCGGASKSTSATRPSAPPTSAFPPAVGKTLTSLRHGLPAGPVLSPSTTSSLETGTPRVASGLFSVDRKFIADAQVAYYTFDHDGSHAKGPYPASFESLAPAPAYQSPDAVSDLKTAGGVYVARIPIPRAGKRVIAGVARINGRLLHTTGFELEIRRHNLKGTPPDIGQRPPLIHTLTLSDVGGIASKIDTRMPAAKDLLRTDFADVVGRKPVVITFATPLLCQSRLCGPVVDVVEQVSRTTKGDVAFIHQEIYNANQVDKGFRSQVQAWKLPTEPWTFVLDRRGRVSERFEGAFSVDELTRAVAAVTR